ncbi:MAG TPA: phytanoyl-CoA dioxygenase family protein [Acidimicrobiia bacterium]|nr:phytanoyl-CoA dioxygenase family protein [Acidimicrobiia bacterium]
MSFHFEPIDFDDFHRVDLPARLAAGNGALAAADLDGVEPIAFRLTDGRAYTYVPLGRGVEVRPGDATAATVVELDEAVWSDFAYELRTCFGLLYADLLAFPRGGFEGLLRWEPAIRCMFDGRTLYDPGAVADLDLGRSFTLDDTDEELRRYLDRAGFLHVRGVFTAGEIDGLRSEVERLRAAATPDDGRSWWATQADGSPVCCRLIYLPLMSATIAALGDDARLRRIAALAGTPLQPTIDCLDGFSVVMKHPEVVEGLSDLPWHRDCGLGGHPVLCPGLQIGIQLDAASAATGQLHMLAGSHACSSHQLDPGDEAQLPAVAIDTAPGDVTVHYGHVLHAAPPPTGGGPGRRALYVSFVRPETLAYIGPGHGYNDVLFERDGAVHSVEEVLS